VRYESQWGTPDLGPLQKIVAGNPLYDGLSELELALYFTRYDQPERARKTVNEAKEFERKRKA
jgi:hypothetical protein